MPARERINYDTPVELTPEQIQASQGTRKEEAAPWESYADEMAVKCPPELEAAIADYAQNYHDNTSNQNKEELARQKELSEAAVDEYKWCSKEEYEDIQERIGRVLHRSELVTMLREKLKLNCWYREHPHQDKLTLLVQRTSNDEPIVGCWVKNGYMPEYTVMGFDERGVPVAERHRGWRTVLLQLILKGLLTEEKAHAVFGKAERRCSERYNSILYGVRHRTEE